MTPMEWGVVLAGACTIVWINWYFFFAGARSTAAEVGSSGVQEVMIAVRGGYDPGTIRVKAGAPVRLVFDRQETSGCSEEVVFPDFGIKRFLPAHDKTVVELAPMQAGTHEFTCGMSMLRGRIVVDDGAEA